MQKHAWIFLTGMYFFSGVGQAQSALDKYLGKSAEVSSSAPKSKNDDGGINKVYKGPNGYWRLDDTRLTGGFCAITYSAASGSAGYVGPVGNSTESFIVFNGPSIPSTSKEVRKRVTLTTGDGEVQTVDAFHAPNSNQDGGAIIVFRLSNIQAAMDGLSDVENLNVVMDAKQVFALKWQGGHTARKAMQTCLNGTAKTTAR